jgi:hypothetical protein
MTGREEDTQINAVQMRVKNLESQSKFVTLSLEIALQP